MPSINIALIILISVTALSIALSVAAWFFISAIGSKLTLLERETEKRSQEFDALRKEHQVTSHSSIGASVIEETDTAIPTESLHHHTSIEDSIQIFRNVGGIFEDSQSASHQPAPESLPPPSPPSPEVIDTSYTEHTVREVPLPPVPPPKGAAYERTGVSHEPAVQKTPDHFRDPVAQPIAVKLYSDVTKDADFQSLWQKITSILQNHHSPTISIDLSNINFLYEKEMDYLEKINYLISNQGGSLALVNCEKDLVTLLNRKQQLESIVKI